MANAGLAGLFATEALLTKAPYSDPLLLVDLPFALRAVCKHEIGTSTWRQGGASILRPPARLGWPLSMYKTGGFVVRIITAHLRPATAAAEGRLC